MTIVVKDELKGHFDKLKGDPKCDIYSFTTFEKFVEEATDAELRLVEEAMKERE